jgi:hypothetical protein
MKLTKFTIFLLLLSFAAFNTLDAQVKTKSKNWKSPTFTIDIAPNFSMPMQEAKGSTIGEFFTYKNYGTKTGFGTAFNFKFGLGAQGQYRPYITLGYTQLQASDNSIAYLDSNIIRKKYPFTGSQLPTSTPGKSEMFLRIPYFGAGFEYAFTNVDKKKRMWYPFIGVEVDMSVIAGTYRQTPTNTSNPGNAFAGQEVTFTMKSDLRVGLGFGVGAAVRLGKVAGISFGGKYKMFNLIGKKSDPLSEENKMNILDKSATDLNTNLSKDRNISALELYVGFTVFLGKTKK